MKNDEYQRQNKTEKPKKLAKSSEKNRTVRNEITIEYTGIVNDVIAEIATIMTSNGLASPADIAVSPIIIPPTRLMVELTFDGMEVAASRSSSTKISIIMTSAIAGKGTPERPLAAESISLIGRSPG